MSLHVIVGAGAVGSATAHELARACHDVRIVSRRGSGPAPPAGAAGAGASTTSIIADAADAADPSAMQRISDGAAAIYNCANPPYNRWPTDWPPISRSLLTTASSTGAVLVTMSNLYGYGPVDHPMTESDPLASTGSKGRVRAAMWTDAIAAHESGRARVAEARASDFFGPGVTATSQIGDRLIPRLLVGKPVRVLGDPDAPHSWTYVPDVGRALAVLGTDERAWGRAWHVPSAPPVPIRQVVEMLAGLAQLPTPRVSQLPRWAVRAVGAVSSLVRELDEVRYQFDRPFILDSSAFASTFGAVATPLPAALAATLSFFQLAESTRCHAA
jgi:nucleoside-diphosphate-sugar epimerase